MDCSKRSAGTVAGLPDDPLVEILSRVPFKSVCRFKCVSKAWRDLIADPHNRKKLPQATEGLFHSYAKTGISEDEDDGPKVDCFSFIDLTARSVPLDIDPSFSFLTELPEIQKLVLLDSCNGLILFKHISVDPVLGDDELGYIVCNPTTKQWRAVPTCARLSTFTYLAFDPAASPHFHLLQFAVAVDGEVEKFVSLHTYSSETGTWSHNQIDEHKEQGQLEGWHHQVRPSLDLYRCAYVNGMLHLIAWNPDQHRQLILAVDAQGKARRMITAPDIAVASNGYVCYIGQSQGRLLCITEETLDVRESSYKLSIWVLQDYNTQEWVLKGTLNSLELFGGTSCRGGMSSCEVIDIHRDCDVIFFTQFSFSGDRSVGDKLLAYDMGSKQVSVIATFKKQILLCMWDFARYVPYFSETPALTNKL